MDCQWQCRKKHSNMYLRQPSKKSAVLLLVFLSLGLIITWVQGKTSKSTTVMRKLQMVHGQWMLHNVAKCTDKKIKRAAILLFYVLFGCITDVLLGILENNNL
jgi:hypothetical protein